VSAPLRPFHIPLNCFAPAFVFHSAFGFCSVFCLPTFLIFKVFFSLAQKANKCECLACYSLTFINQLGFSDFVFPFPSREITKV